MSLAHEPLPEIPTETVRVARAAFPKGNPWLQLRDQLGVIYQDQAFASLFAVVGQPAIAPWRLALVTLLQFAEGVTDRQAADAVRSRLDWKYLLALPLDDPGFDASDKDGLPPAAKRLSTPLENEARYAEKRGEGWLGYKVHFTNRSIPG